MSRENIDVVRGWVAGLRATTDVWDPRGDYYPVEKFPESRPCHGTEQIERFISDFHQAWGEHEFKINAITPVGEDRVLVQASLAAEGRGSGLSLQGDVFHCFWLRHGRIFRQEDHLTLRGALRALGLNGDTLEAVGLSE